MGNASFLSRVGRWRGRARRSFWRSPPSLRALCLCAPLLLANGAPESPAETPQLTLLHAQDDTIERAVLDSGTASLIFHLKGTNGAELDIDLGDFLSENQHQARVSIGRPDAGDPSQLARLVFKKGEYRKELKLTTAGMVEGVAYRGTLTASGAGRDPKVWKVTLQKPVPAGELVADVARADLQMQRWSLFPRAGNPVFNVTLREKSGAIPIQGVTVRRAPGSEIHGNFDLKDDLLFSLDGQKIEDLTSWPTEQHIKKRSILAGDQRTLRVEVRDLPRGDHKLSLQIAAVNANSETTPKVEINVRVRHARWAAALVLSLAILISYLITKGIANWRQRTRLRELTQTLGQDWLEEVRELAPVVWLQATRRQALTVLERFALLPAPDELTNRLEVAVKILHVMKRYLEVRERVDGSISLYMLHFRLRNALNAVVGAIEPQQLDEANEKALLAALDQLEQDIDAPARLYRPYVVTAQKRTAGMGAPSRLPAMDAPTRQKLELLWQKYVTREAAPDASLQELVSADRICASMRVLIRHVAFGDEDVVERLVPLIAQDDPEDIDIVSVLSITNNAFWGKIKRAAQSGNVKISPSELLPSATPRRALVPMRFSVEIDDPVLNDTFMAKQGMIAEWEFALLPRKWKSKPIPWHAHATGKRLLQFAPARGTLKAGVTLRHENDRSQKIEGSIAIGKAPGSLRSQLFAVQELVLTFVAAGIAFASGLVIFYEANPIFGSIQNYLALFTWGVGVDQGKNLAQTFQALSAQAKGGTGDG